MQLARPSNVHTHSSVAAIPYLGGQRVCTQYLYKATFSVPSLVGILLKLVLMRVVLHVALEPRVCVLYPWCVEDGVPGLVPGQVCGRSEQVSPASPALYGADTTSGRHGHGKCPVTVPVFPHSPSVLRSRLSQQSLYLAPPGPPFQ